MDPLAEALASSPELFPFAFDARSAEVTFIRLSHSEYQGASFLDGRIAPGRMNQSVAWPQLVRAVEEARLRESCHFLFHIGHVGSTLLSRLLGKHEEVLSLREPEILRTLALARDPALLESHLPVFLKLWSRRFAAGQLVLVKATSFASDLAAPILARSYQPRALFMGVKPEVYLATILGGANAPAEANALAPFRRARLQQRIGCISALEQMSLGETIAMGWVCEALALAEAAREAKERILVLDFDFFLASPRDGLVQALAHFGLAASEQELDAILSGSEMRTYSKAPEHSYDAALRTAVLNEARLRSASEIRRGLQWLERATREFAELESAVELFC